MAGAVLTGVAAGLLAAALLTVTAEPSIAQAIKLEQSRAAVDATGAEEIVSRPVQKGIGLFAAYGLAGGGFGLLFAAGFVVARRRQGDSLRCALTVGAVLAGGLTVAPWLKYPPNPPAVGDPATLGRRQLLYVAVVVVGLLVGMGAARLSGWLRARGCDDALRLAAVVAAVAAAMGAAYALLPPAPDAVSAPATLVWRFRLASLGGNLALWTALVVGFGLLARTRPAAAVSSRPATPSAPAASVAGP